MTVITRNSKQKLFFQEVGTLDDINVVMIISGINITESKYALPGHDICIAQVEPRVRAISKGKIGSDTPKSF
ncbi:MAG: hypothetical protein N4J56_005209 [Chroococcidiopsis sp. SAG 2025]|nr:hypothetical protein [Chroococcidiopsis sp. SAG 2025]